MNGFRRALRRILPLSLRQTLAQARRRLVDVPLDFDDGRTADLSDTTLQIELKQQIMPSALFENKLANMRNAARLLNHTGIEPGGLWSFWRSVGAPTLANGFVVGRNLVDGKLTTQVGGGICQPSSLMYHLALLSGLAIVERHPHSIDIYEEKDRFTPLGADATVVWGFKDLRMTNPHGVRVVFECFVEGHAIIGRVHASQALPRYDVEFQRRAKASPFVEVDAMINGAVAVTTLYEQRQGMILQAPTLGT